MKILSQGQIPEPPTPEWVGMTIECPHCKAKFELEKGDNVSTYADRGHPDTCDRGIEVACPTCGKKLVHSLKTGETRVFVDWRATFIRAAEAQKTARPFYPPAPAYDHYRQPPAPYLDPTTRPMCETGDPLPERGYTTSP